MSRELVNDVHSRLNETLVDSVVPVDSLESIGTAIDRAPAAAGHDVHVTVGPRCSAQSRASFLELFDSSALVDRVLATPEGILLGRLRLVPHAA